MLVPNFEDLKGMNQIELERPGAGLPWLEARLSRYLLLPLAIRLSNWDSALKVFESEGAHILKIVDSVPADQFATPVLIPRVRGIEDSSRNWSLAGLLEHLTHAGGGMLTIIKHLASGKTFDRPVRIEDVKPVQRDSGSVRLEFEKFQKLYLDEIQRVKNRAQLLLTHAHPWFWQMNAFEWHVLACFHQRIHKNQAIAIAKMLKASQ